MTNGRRSEGTFLEIAVPHRILMHWRITWEAGGWGRDRLDASQVTQGASRT
jgi:hypothetical protein